MSESSQILRRAVRWSWIALLFSALHFGGDLAENRAQVIYFATRGLPVSATASGLPTDSIQFTGVLIFSALLYSLFVLGIVRASRGSVRWLTSVFFLDLIWAAFSNGAVGITICPPPCPWRYIPTGNLQDVAHFGSLLSGATASFYTLGARRTGQASYMPSSLPSGDNRQGGQAFEYDHPCCWRSRSI